MVDDGKSKGKRMGNVSAGMHETLLACIHFENALAFVAWQNSFYGEALLTADPIRLYKCTFPHNIPTLEEITVRVACECGRFNFGGTFHVRRDKKADLHDLQAFNPDETGIIIRKPHSIFEVRGTSCREGQENVR